MSATNYVKITAIGLGDNGLYENPFGAPVAEHLAGHLEVILGAMARTAGGLILGWKREPFDITDWDGEVINEDSEAYMNAFRDSGLID